MPRHNVLQHVAFIMDGNGRWAEAQGQPRTYGHEVGTENTRTIIEHVRQAGIPYLSLYAFSSENWKRSPEEINVLMGLFLSFMQNIDIEKMREANVRVRFIGRRDRLMHELVTAMERMERETASGTATHLQIAIDYGGRDELVRAFNKLASSDRSITEEVVSDALDTAGIPDPDLVIRTGGNMRTSNFMPWQTVYSEWRFTETPWPAFSVEELDQLIDNFLGVERRFGAVLNTSQ